MNSNIGVWRTLQARDYFATHPCYTERDFNRDDAANALRWLGPLRPDMKVAIVGCGYGRETAGLAPLIGHVWGIDVSERILDESVAYLAARHIHNFTPVLADDFQADIPHGLDAFFAFNTMQHLTRDLVRHYFTVLGQHLVPGGGAVVQFLESRAIDAFELDASPTAIGEPSVSWNSWQIVQLVRHAQLELQEIRSLLINPLALWHWAIVRRAG